MASQEEVIAFIKGVLEVKELSISAARGRIDGWESLRHIRLIQKLENQYGVRFTVSEIGRLDSVGKIIDYLRNKNIILD